MFIMGFTVVIPVYNEEEIIEENTGKLIKFLDRLNEPYRIIIGDNGSTDSTYTKGKELMKRHPGKVIFFHVRKKGSVGTVFRESVAISPYEKIISVDMDLSTDLDFIPRCARLLDECSMVIGSKRVGSQERPLIRKIASGVFICLVKMLLGMSFRDYSLSCKGYRKSDIADSLDLIDKGSSYVISIAYMIKRKGLKIKEVPVSCLDIRRSKFNIFDESIYRLRNLIVFWIRVETRNL